MYLKDHYYYLSLEGMVWSTTDDAYLADISSRCGKHPFAHYAKTACIPDFPQSPLHIASERVSCATTSPVQITLVCKASKAKKHLEQWRHKEFGAYAEAYICRVHYPVRNSVFHILVAHSGVCVCVRAEGSCLLLYTLTRVSIRIPPPLP